MSQRTEIQMGDNVSNAPVIETGAGSQDTPRESQLENNAEPSGEQERPLSPRERSLREIYAKREQRRTEELQYGENMDADARARTEAERLMSGGEDAGYVPSDTPNPEAGRVQNEPPVQTPPPAQQPAQMPPAAPQTPPTSETRTRVNIGGTYVELTAEELSDLVAAGARARVAGQSAPVQQPQQQVRTQQPAPAQPAPAQQSINYDELFSQEDAARTYEQITSGSEEDGANALRNMAVNIARQLDARRGPQQPQIDVKQVEAQVLAKIRAEDQQRRNLETIGKEFPDIFANETLSRFAGTEVYNLAQKYAGMGIQKPMLEVYREACSNVQSVVGKTQSPSVSETQQTNVQPAAQTVTVNRQPVDKGTLPRVPTGASTRGQGTRSAQPQSRKDIVENMRKARGQAPMR